MLFSTVVSDAFDHGPSLERQSLERRSLEGPSLEPPQNRPAAETLALYARALDEMRAAYAQVSADYAGALQTASTLRATLLRADTRRRCDDSFRTSLARVDALEARVAAQAALIRRLQRCAPRRDPRARIACGARF